MADPEGPSPLTGKARDAAQAPDLCTKCGLCCMGAIHVTAKLDEDEIRPATNIGLPVLDRPTRPGFALPCPKLSGTTCAIFGHRPRVCARYRCQVLIDFEDGVRNYSESLEHVREALRLVGEAGASRALAYPGGDHDLDRDLPTLRLQLYLDRHFRNAADRKSFETRGVESVMEESMEGRLFVRSDEALFAEVGDDVLALHVANGRCHGMEMVAADVWRILDEPASLDAICDRLLQSYEVDPAECRADVASLLRVMLEEGLIKIQ